MPFLVNYFSVEGVEWITTTNATDSVDGDKYKQMFIQMWCYWRDNTQNLGEVGGLLLLSQCVVKCTQIILKVIKE